MRRGQSWSQTNSAPSEVSPLMLSTYLISLGSLYLGAELLHRLVQASVAAQLGLNVGQVGAPLPLLHPPLVLLHPAQQIVDVTQGDLVQLGPHPGGGLLQDLDAVDLGHGDLRGGHTRLQAQVVLTADVYEPLVETVHSTDGNRPHVMNISTEMFPIFGTKQ